MSPLHRLDMFGVGAPGFERFLRGKTEHGELLAVVGFERLDRQKAGKTADDVVHALAESVVFVDRGAVTQLQIANDNHFANHVSLPLGDGFPLPISSVSRWLCYIAHPNLNGLPASDCLWSVHVAPYVSICRYRPVAAAGCRAGRFDPKASQASLAWLWLPARLSPAAEQQHSALQAEGSDAADVA